MSTSLFYIKEQPDYLCHPNASEESFIWVNRSEWRAKPPKNFDSHEAPFNKIIIAHTVTTTNQIMCNFESCSQVMRDIQLFNQQKFFDIFYSFVICGKAVYEARGWNQVPATLRENNEGTIQIAFMGDYRIDIPFNASMKALEGFVEFGIENQVL